jgi:hypothetical protein
MKIALKSSQGSVLLPALLACAILGGALASYLTLVRVQNNSVLHSQSWNSAIPISEAGIEEALAHINDSQIGTNFATDGWVRTNESVFGDAFYLKRTIGEGRYEVWVSTNRFPMIKAAGYVNDTSQGTELWRKVRVTTTQWATGMKGLIAKTDINMTTDCQVDSFDSEDARYSTRGRYDASKHKDGGYAGAVNGNLQGGIVYGSVGTGPNGTASGNVGDFGWLSGNTGIEPGHYANDLNLAFPEVQVPFTGGAATAVGGSLTLTNFDYWSTMITSDVYPTNAVSPVTTNNFGNMTVTNYASIPNTVLAGTITTNTTPIRSKTLAAAGTYINLTQQGAWYYYDLITSYTYPSRTYTYSTTAANNTATTQYYDYVLSGSKYQMDNLSLSGGQQMIITGTNVTLYIPGDFSMTGNSKLIITPGASLKIYVGGRTSLAGNGVFNYTLDASHFMYYGLPSNTRIDISGNAAFTGCIYAPRADLNMNGSGNAVYDVVGATVTKTATMNGHFHFHYDERLGRSQVLSKYSVASWIELPKNG